MAWQKKVSLAPVLLALAYLLPLMVTTLIYHKSVLGLKWFAVLSSVCLISTREPSKGPP